MPKKLRVAILYNQPVAGTEEERKYITENGQLQTVSAHNGKAPVPAGTKTPLNGQHPSVDLSEIGVMEEMEDIKAALSSLGYRPSILNVDSNIFRLIDYLKNERPDIIFNLVECVENEALQEMNVAGIYELLNIPYTGAPALTLGIALHKHRVKEILAYHGILTPAFQVFHVADRIIAREDMRYPMIVKPSHEDASVGISDKSVVYSAGELRKRVRFIHQEFEQPALVEEYIEGREFNVAVIGNRKPVAMPVSEIDFSGLTPDMHNIVSYDAKWMHGTVAFDGTRGVCPADIPPALEAGLKEIALRCYGIIGCRDYARVDFRVAKNGTPYVLEVNPNPDISDDAGFARSARAYGLTFPQIIGRIMELAAERCR